MNNNKWNNTMVTFEIQHSGNICPRSGIWSEIETGQLITIARGERFPLLNQNSVQWKMKEAAQPVPISKQQFDLFG